MNQKEATAALKLAQVDLTEANGKLDNISADQKTLLDKITALENASGEASPELQAAIDDVVNTAKGIKEKSTTIDESVPDAETPPADGGTGGEATPPADGSGTV